MGRLRERVRLTVVAPLLLLAMVAGVPRVSSAEEPSGTEVDSVGRTPPRLAFVDGQVSFWRPGAEEWVAAQVNTPLAPGDELYTGSPGNLEVQIGARAWVRAWANTQLGLASLEPDFVQLKVTTGYMSLDLRRLDPGHTVEVGTPNAVFTIERPGYYRMNILQDRTSFIARRGGRATVTSTSGTAATIAPSEEVVVDGTDSPTVTTYVAPALDEWDRWNYARSEHLIDAVSSRYVSSGVYGVEDLDRHGTWRVVDPYGPVWVPTAVPAGWAPYTTGAWMWDPFYGWTWVDTAPWGWAPYHYGRWVFVSGYWGWAPGPLVVRPVYAPALVAFFGHRVGVTVGLVGPSVGWVALSWGEPLIPWWGRVGFVGVPWWAGWGGPRIVNNVVIQRTTIVHAHEINIYRNVVVQKSVVVVPRDRFGHGPVTRARLAQVEPSHLEPLRGPLKATPVRESLAPHAVRGARPPEAALKREVVLTRPPQDPERWLRPHGIPESRKAPAPAARVVPPPARDDADAPSRPPFGESKIERPRSPEPPRLERARPPAARPARPERVPPGQSRVAPSPAAPTPTTPAPGAPESAPPAAAPPQRPAPPGMSEPRRDVPAPLGRQAPPVPRAEPPPVPRVPEPRPGPAAPRIEPQPTPPSPRVEPRPGPPAPRAEPPPVPRAPEPRPGPAAPRFEPRPAPPSPHVQPPSAVPTPPRAQPGPPGREPPSVRESPRPEGRPLPGEPANRLFPGRSEMAPGRGDHPRLRGPEPGPPEPAGERGGDRGEPRPGRGRMKDGPGPPR